GGDGARTCTEAASCGTGVGCAAARSISASMSPLVTRPSLPLPGTAAGSMPVSVAIFRTEGASGASAGANFAGADAWGAGAAGAGGGLGAGDGAAFAGAGDAPVPGLISP